MSDHTSDASSPEETFFDFKCPYCNEIASFPQSAIGQASECPICAETFIVPDVGSEFGRRLSIPIVTNRLTLRRLDPSDTSDLAEFMSDEELFAFTDGRTMDDDEVGAWLANDSKVKLTTPEQSFYLAVVLNDANRVIGWVAFNFDHTYRKQAGLQLVIDRRHQRKGFGTEAFVAVLRFCLEEIRLHRVVAWCDARNQAAQRVFEKAGMRYEAQFLEDRPNGDNWADTLWFGLLQHEWPPAEKS